MNDGTLYFAYGSNLNRQHWRDWCRRKGWDPAVLQLLEPARMPDLELAFTRWSPVWSGGVLDVVDSPSSSVEGMLCEVGPGGWQALDAKEGAPTGYCRFEHAAITRSGTEVAVVSYRVAEPVPFVEPDPRYLEVVLEGLRFCNLSTAPLVRAASGGSHGRR